jgi:hypothetical protein
MKTLLHLKMVKLFLTGALMLLFSITTYAQDDDDDSLPTLRGQCSFEVSEYPIIWIGNDGIEGRTESALYYHEQGEFMIIWNFEVPNHPNITKEQKVIIKDTEGPSVHPFDEVYVMTGEMVALPNVPMWDNCSDEISITTESNREYSEQGIYTIFWSFDDGHGNATVRSQEVEVTAPIAPIAITCNESITINNTARLCTATTILTPPVVTGNCKSIGNALDFNYNQVVVKESPALRTWTIETWVYVKGYANYETIYDMWDGYYGLWLGDDHIQWWYSSDYPLFTGETEVTHNQWHHIALTYNGTVMTAYLDGNLDGSVNLDGQSLFSTNANIGNDKWGDTFLGSMDEFRIWNGARTQSEIRSNMDKQINAQAGLALLYNFNQGIAGGSNPSETIVFDASGNGHDGELSNFELIGDRSNWVSGNVILSPVVISPVVTNDAPETYNIGTTTVTWTAEDACGNTSICEQIVKVIDNEGPSVDPLDEVYVMTGEMVALPNVPMWDNCSDEISITTESNREYSEQGIYTIFWSFDDGHGNATVRSQDINVTAPIAPIAIAQDVTVTLDENGNATIEPSEIYNGPNNVPFHLSLDISHFNCTNIGDNIVTLTVTDDWENTDYTTATVTILEHFKETLDLRSLSSFEAFTGTGAVTNSGNFTGNVGTNVGALTGFTGPNFNGSIHFNDALTAQAELDLLKVYIHLNNIPVTHPSANNAAHAPAFGSGEVLTPGVYDIGGAGSVAGTLTLNGQGDQNAVFIMKFKGAFTAGAGSNIVLTNGADAANVFWVAQGALSVGANSVIKGTLLAYPGAITLGVNSSIEGRLLSSVGAITVGVGGTATMPGTMNIPINPMISYAPAVDVLGSIENFSLFTSNGAVANASTSGILGDVGADVGAISGFATSAHIGSFYSADAVTAQAKIDLNNAYAQLMSIPTTVPNHTPAFGSGEILQPGVYSTPGAGSLAGIVTLNGGGDPDAIFIFKFNGAFAAAAQSKVILSNGTRRCNVFWISEGAASIGSFSTLKGTILAHNGAATMGAGGNLEGRLLSTGGAIGFSTGVVYTVVHDVECDTYTEQKTAVKEAVSSVPDSIEETLVIYPNPSRGVFNIKLAIFNVETEIYLFDTTGKLIARKSISKENNSGNMIAIGNNNLSSGIYLVKIITKNETVTKKVIVEKSN